MERIFREIKEQTHIMIFDITVIAAVITVFSAMGVALIRKN